VESAGSGMHQNEGIDRPQGRESVETDGVLHSERVDLTQTKSSVSSHAQLNRIEVDIFGQKYNIIGEESAEHIRFMAQIVDGKMREIAAMSSGMSSLKVAILAALNISEEALKLQKIVTRLADRQDDLILKLDQAIGG
jgi:cell division protein ZapA